MKHEKSPSPPEDNRSVLLCPPLTDYGKYAQENRKALGISCSPKVLAILEKSDPVKEIIEKSVSYMKTIGIDPPNFASDKISIISTGHQPLFFHPGIVAKIEAISAQAKKNEAVPLFITVDSDEMRDHFVSYPSIKDKTLTEHKFEFDADQPKRIFESAKAVSDKKLGECFDTIESSLTSSADLEKPAEAFKSFRNNAANMPSAKDFVAGSILLRRAWNKKLFTNIFELPVSEICATKAFKLFAVSIIDDIKNFVDVYNSALDDYRKRHKLRYKANPFPDLVVSGDKTETPFWQVDKNGKRQAYYISGQGSSDDILNGSVNLRPRAITLSLFMRIFVADLFVHGTGGAKYDEVTDFIIKNWYGFDPPKLAVASATLHCGIERDNPAKQIDEIKETLRNIEQHPDRMGHLAQEDIGSLIARKIKLIYEISIAAPAEKKELGRAISELNKKMVSAFTVAKNDLEKNLRKLEKAGEEYTITTKRDWPYFLYDPDDVAQLFE